MLKLQTFISKGASRICFENPSDANKCIKIMIDNRKKYYLSHELQAFKETHYLIGEYLLNYTSSLIETNLGYGLECDLLRDYTHDYSKPLSEYLYQNKIDEEILQQLRHFFFLLFKYNIYFYDFNLKNFIILNSGKTKKLYYSDLKSYNRYKAWTFFKLEKIIPYLSRKIMAHRINVFYTQIQNISSL